MQYFITSLGLCSFLFFTACNKNDYTQDDSMPSSGHILMEREHTSASHLVDVTIANQLISSYLNSIDTITAYTPIKSFIVGVSELRELLLDTNVTELKIFLAHHQDYLSNGNTDVYSGVDAQALTLVISGVNNTNDYVYLNTSNVINKINGCPINCRLTGSASADTLYIP